MHIGLNLLRSSTPGVSTRPPHTFTISMIIYSYIRFRFIGLSPEGARRPDRPARNQVLVLAPFSIGHADASAGPPRASLHVVPRCTWCLAALVPRCTPCLSARGPSLDEVPRCTCASLHSCLAAHRASVHVVPRWTKCLCAHSASLHSCVVARRASVHAVPRWTKCLCAHSASVHSRRPTRHGRVAGERMDFLGGAGIGTGARGSVLKRGPSGAIQTPSTEHTNQWR